MNILITGAKGFIGKHLVAILNSIREGKEKSFGTFPELTIFEYDIDSDPALLDRACACCDFVFHLAGVNRPQQEEEFTAGNVGFTATLLEKLKQRDNPCPVMLSSSIQAERDNPYGRSKRAGEELVFAYSKETGAPVYVYRFPNVFGKWCRPNYNSAIATFCHNIARNLPIQVNDPSVVLNLVYIDDLVAELIRALQHNPTKSGDYCAVPVVHTMTLGEIVALLYDFKACREQLRVPDLSDPFTKKLYATYLSYLPTDQFSYPLTMHVDHRGSFTEIIRTPDRGQFSVNISKPGITKGNHWHHTKHEKFLVVSGRGVIRLRPIHGDQVVEYYVSGDKLEVVDIPPGYTHNIENLGDTDMVTFMWCSECFDPDRPDTIFLEV